MPQSIVELKPLLSAVGMFIVCLYYGLRFSSDKKMDFTAQRWWRFSGTRSAEPITPGSITCLFIVSQNVFPSSSSFDCVPTSSSSAPWKWETYWHLRWSYTIRSAPFENYIPETRRMASRASVLLQFDGVWPSLEWQGGFGLVPFVCGLVRS